MYSIIYNCILNKNISDAGILLSNSVIRKMIPNVDWCVRNAFSTSDDDNFGRCVLHSVNLPCQTSIQVSNIKILNFKINSLNFICLFRGNL